MDSKQTTQRLTLAEDPPFDKGLYKILVDTCTKLDIISYIKSNQDLSSSNSSVFELLSERAKVCEQYGGLIERQTSLKQSNQQGYGMKSVPMPQQHQINLQIKGEKDHILRKLHQNTEKLRDQLASSNASARIAAQHRAVQFMSVTKTLKSAMQNHLITVINRLIQDSLNDINESIPNGMISSQNSSEDIEQLSSLDTLQRLINATEMRDEKLAECERMVLKLENDTKDILGLFQSEKVNFTTSMKRMNTELGSINERVKVLEQKIEFEQVYLEEETTSEIQSMKQQLQRSEKTLEKERILSDTKMKDEQKSLFQLQMYLDRKQGELQRQIDEWTSKLNRDEQIERVKLDSIQGTRDKDLSELKSVEAEVTKERELKRQRDEKEQRERDERKRKEDAAVTIQSYYRGWSLRVSLGLINPSAGAEKKDGSGGGKKKGGKKSKKGGKKKSKK